MLRQQDYDYVAALLRDMAFEHKGKGDRVLLREIVCRFAILFERGYPEAFDCDRFFSFCGVDSMASKWILPKE